MHIVVCWKWVPLRTVVDPLTGAITAEGRSFGASAADEAALEVALSLVAAAAAPTTVTVATAGPDEADGLLRRALASGADSAVRCPAPADAGSAEVAAALATVSAQADLVLCGDHSADRGSGSVPGFVAAHLGVGQALGVVAVEHAGHGLLVDRRLDRGRRERLRVGLPAVVSVEGAVAGLRRAALPAVLAAEHATIDVGPTVVAGGGLVLGEPRPFRPPTRPRSMPPAAGPLERVLAITQANVDRTPPRVIHAEPAEAADEIIAQLRTWGYLPDDS